MKLSFGATARAALALALWTNSLVTAKPAATSPTVDSITNDLARVESVREIKSVQRTFAQLALHGRWGDMAALFADDGVFRWGAGNPGANILDNSDATFLTGPAAVESWLRTDAGSMDGLKLGSLHALINDQPVVSLSADGRSAKGRWHSLKFLGDGAGKTRIEGGIMQNEYVLTTSAGHGNRWKIKLLRYYPLFAGNYKKGWENVGGNSLPVVPFHFTADGAGEAILSPYKPHNGSKVASRHTELGIDELKYRVTMLNDEDEVRNLQHICGHYVDRRMWPDVVDLFASDGIVSFDGRGSAPGAAGIQSALDRMGPEGLTRGILNDHPIYQTLVEISPDGLEATSRGLEIGMIGDSIAKTAEWQFCVFRHKYIKDAASGIWKIKELAYTRVMVANYTSGWAFGGTLPPKATPSAPPPFLDVLGHVSDVARKPTDWQPSWREDSNSTETLLADIQRRLARSAAFDETENVSSAYGYYADDIRCIDFATLHADKGFKMSPGVGWYHSPQRIGQACIARYGNQSSGAAPLRASIPFHWRVQPVILVSHDGRSATMRVRNLQIGTSKGGTGAFPGFNGGMYHDQFVLEEKNGVVRRKLWCLTIDEFYWQSGGWSSGWAGVNSTALGRRQSGIGGYIADVSITDPKMHPREVGFMGGPPPTVRWPDIQRVWWSFRNPVSGRVPESYWPGCVPCRTARPEWQLTANGYQEPATGPTLVTAKAQGTNVTVTVAGGPDEPVTGLVQLRKGNRSSNLMGEVVLSSANEIVTFAVPPGDLRSGANELAVYFLGSGRLQPGKATVVVTVP